MKKKILLLVVLVLGVQSWAQTYTVTHNFTNTPDGGLPQAGLVLNNNTLYGVTAWGGTNNTGAIFKLNPNGASYSVIKSFSPLVNYFNQYTNTDGAHPAGDLTIVGDTIYGTTSAGGHSGNGTVFRMSTNGTQFTVLKDFTNDVKGVAVEGATPKAALILSGSTLYGTVAGIGGGVFRLNTNGSGFAIIKNIGPSGNLILSGDTLYGINSQTVFSMKTNGLNYTTLRTFTNSPDGIDPQTGLVLSGNTLYGTTAGGGSTTFGTIFKVNTDGSGYAILADLGFFEIGTQPQSSLVLMGNTLYGNTYMGGPAAYGAVFKINTDGTGLAVVNNFVGNAGQFPVGNLASDGTTLYGTTTSAGAYNAGTVYSLNLTPMVAVITPTNSSFNVSWNAISNHVYQLQFTTNLLSTNWQNVGISITATNSRVSTLILQGPEASRLYRVNLLR